MITVLTGSNSYLIAEKIRERSTAFDGEVEKFDGSELEARNLPDLFMGASLFSPQRLVVLRGISANKSLWTELEQWIERVPPETEIILVEPNPDKRTKAYKQLQKHASITELGDLREPDLANWLHVEARRKGAELPPDALRYLIGYVGRDQWRLRSELDKLILAGKPITSQLIQDVTEPYPEATAFELLDAVFAGRVEDARRLLALLRDREDPYQFFGLLSSQVMAVLAIVSAGTSRPDQVAKDLGLHPFVVKKLSGPAHKLGVRRVERLVEQLAHADERIKTSGVDPWRQLEITLLDIAVTN